MFISHNQSSPTRELSSRRRSGALNSRCVLDKVIRISQMFRSVNRRLLPPANEVCEGYVFTHVCHSVHRGVSASVHAVKTLTPPWSRYPPGNRHTPQSIHIHPLGADIPHEQTPLPSSSVCWEIRTISGRYASYWNAYLFFYSFMLRIEKQDIEECGTEKREIYSAFSTYFTGMIKTYESYSGGSRILRGGGANPSRWHQNTILPKDLPINISYPVVDLRGV